MIIYLHGFRSGPQSGKVRLLTQFLAAQQPPRPIWCEQLSHVPFNAIAQAERAIAACADKPMLVGSSLGGFYATWLAEKHGLKAVLINPFVPHETFDFSLFLGEHDNLYTGERFLFTEASVQQVLALDVPKPKRPDRLWLLAEEADEVLDYRYAVKRYAGARQTVLPDGDHSFTRWPDYLDAVMRFGGKRMSPHNKGLLSAIAAFTTWGLAPLYFRLLGQTSALEIVSHRIIWSVVLLAVVLALRHGFGVIRKVAGNPRLAGLLMLTTILTATNWLLFVWAINNGHVLESSLGYFIAPLINVLFGRLFLGERLRAWQAMAVALATCGVLWRIWHLGALPWIPLSLSITFALYGLLRKRAPIESLDGLFVETCMALPLALGFVSWVHQTGSSHFGPTPLSMGLLMGTGIITAIPLWLFTNGAPPTAPDHAGLLPVPRAPVCNSCSRCWYSGNRSTTLHWLASLSSGADSRCFRWTP